MQDDDLLYILVGKFTNRLVINRLAKRDVLRLGNEELKRKVILCLNCMCEHVVAKLHFSSHALKMHLLDSVLGSNSRITIKGKLLTRAALSFPWDSAMLLMTGKT